MLDWLALTSPTIISIVGVWMSMEAPSLETKRKKYIWRAALILFGIFTSVITFFQQNNSHRDTDETKQLLWSIADAVGVKRGTSPAEITKQILGRLENTEKKVEVLSNPPRDDEAMYQDGREIARIGAVSRPQSPSRITFEFVTSGKPIDFSKPIELRDERLNCHSWSGGPTQTSGRGSKLILLTYTDVWCEVIEHLGEK